MVRLRASVALLVVFWSFTAASQVVNITSISMYWDDHIIVCTNISSMQNETFMDNTYTLITILQDLIDTTLENSTSASLDTTGNETCIISQNKYQLNGFHTLLITVLSQTSEGIILAEGKKQWSYIFPIQQPTIRIIATTSFIFTMWNIVDNYNSAYNYNLTLRGTTLSKTITLHSRNKYHSTYTFQNPAFGKHSVCVLAFVYDNPIYTSNTYCSDIVDIQKYGVMAIPSLVKDLKAMATSNSSIFIKWRHPDEDNENSDLTFVVAWSMNGFFLKESELDVQNPFNLGGFFCDSKFLDNSISSTEIKELWTGGNYTVCVTAITNNVARGSSCDTITLVDYHFISPPQDLRYNPGPTYNYQHQNGDTPSISWTNLEENVSFWVKWHGEISGDTNHAETVDTEKDISLPPGLWNISVRAMQGHSASAETYATASVKGLIIYSQQTSSNSLAVSWDEWPPPLWPVHYNATLNHKEDVLQQSPPIYCSGNHTDCQYQFSNLSIGVPVMLEVFVQNEDEIYVQSSSTIIEAIGDVHQLMQDFSNEDEVAVKWAEVENANIYLLSVYPDKDLSVLRFRAVVTLPTRLRLPLKSLEDNVVQLQPCKSVDRCGSIASVTLSMEPTPSHKPKFSAVGITASLLLLAFAIIIGITVKKVQQQHHQQYEELEAEPLILVNDAWRNYPRYVPERDAGPSNAHHYRNWNDMKKGKGKNKSSKTTREVLIHEDP